MQYYLSDLKPWAILIDVEGTENYEEIIANFAQFPAYPIILLTVSDITKYDKIAQILKPISPFILLDQIKTALNLSN